MTAEKTEIVLATRNRGKIGEYRSLFQGIPVRLLSLQAFPDMPVVVEDGKTFQENARKKALAISRKAGRLAISDDSGLEVDLLHGRPGVHSSRFSGDGATDRENVRRLLGLMEGAHWEDRGARFVCVICIADPRGRTATATGICKGTVCFEMRGINGFGYDPIFVPDGYTRTMAEMSPEIKNRISHRAEAMKRLPDVLESFIRAAGR